MVLSNYVAAGEAGVKRGSAVILPHFPVGAFSADGRIEGEAINPSRPRISDR
jgi:hypothetical protein